MKVKEESEKVGLSQLNIQKTKIMASGPITSWPIDGETMEIVTDFIFLGSNITADGDWSHEIKRCLSFERKPRTNLDSILKSKDITLPTNILLVKGMVFPVVMYEWESWTINKAEHRRIDALNWTVGEDSWESLGLQGDPTIPSYRKSVLNIHWKDWCWSWSCSSSTLPTWFEELTHWKRPWCWERLKVAGEGTTEDEMVGWHHWLDGHEFRQGLGVGDGQGSLAFAVHWVAKSRTWLSDWTELKEDIEIA